MAENETVQNETQVLKRDTEEILLEAKSIADSQADTSYGPLFRMLYLQIEMLSKIEDLVDRIDNNVMDIDSNISDLRNSEMRK